MSTDSESIDSSMEYRPTGLSEDLENASKRPSSESRKLRLSRTETAKSLKELGLTELTKLGPVARNIVAPPVQDPIFPEEYTLETETGLVPVKTLQSLGRVRSSRSRLSEEDEGEGEGEGRTPHEKDSELTAIDSHGKAEAEDEEEKKRTRRKMET
ncbi:uncharacterized protein PRCAT00005355001 [Priceomyces carsonii]|uniref:uncharacterized protein n=1 Tax=Priceomyces carsonii TaxID=28549 RepID=UPI002EDA114D|nr:unnamed protein product [Priceomyces carsonii]